MNVTLLMVYFYVIQTYTLGSKIILGVFFAALAYMILHYSFKMIEMVYVIKKRKPLYTHFYRKKRKLTTEQEAILQKQYTFYNKLEPKEQVYFKHRVASFIIDKEFVSREGIVINDEVKVLISATAVMLTFGFRDFYIGLIDKIFVYPDAFYSNSNDDYHKGEFNPKLKTLVLSWKHFLEGYEIENDNMNLGIHEFAHAIHLNSIKERDVSSAIFSDSFKELRQLLAAKENLRQDLIASKYFRDYAYTNQFEFLAVIIESFIETPEAFKSQFPEVYHKTKQMLNFDFAGY